MYGNIAIHRCDEAAPCSANITNNSCDDLAGVLLAPGDARSCSFKALVSGNTGQTVTDTVAVCGNQTNTGQQSCGDDDASVTITDVPALPALGRRRSRRPARWT